MKKLLIILGVLGASFSAIFVRVANAPSTVLVFYRVLFAAAMLLPYVLIKHRSELRGLAKKNLVLAGLGGMFLSLHFIFFFEALTHTSIAVAVVLTDTEVFFVALTMLIFFGDKISLIGWAGIFLTFAGAVVIAIAGSGGGADGNLKGAMLALAAAASTAIYTLIGSVCRKTMSTAAYTFIVYTVSAIVVLMIMLARGISPIGYHPVNVLSGLGMAVFCTLLGHSIFSWGLKFEKASYVSLAKLLEPVFASLLGLLLFREIPGVLVIIGGLAVMSGVGLVSIRRTR